MKMPPNFEAWNRAHQGAYRKGIAAFRAGLDLSDCPYSDRRKPNGRLTWSRAFIAAWEDGFRDAAQAQGAAQ